MVDVSGKHPFDTAKEQLANAGRTATERKARERVLSPTDGRVLRSKGKTEVVNYRVTPAFKEDLYELAKAEEVSMTTILERAVAAYKEARKRK